MKGFSDFVGFSKIIYELSMLSCQRLKNLSKIMITSEEENKFDGKDEAFSL